MIARRNFLLGLGAAIAAPAIVRAGSLMPVKALPADLMATDLDVENLLPLAHERYAYAWLDSRAIYAGEDVENLLTLAHERLRGQVRLEQGIIT